MCHAADCCQSCFRVIVAIQDRPNMKVSTAHPAPINLFYAGQRSAIRFK